MTLDVRLFFMPAKLVLFDIDGTLLLTDGAGRRAIVAALGEAGIDAVATNLRINFLTRPEARDMLASVSLIRLGRRLAVGEARLYSDGQRRHGGSCDCHLCLPSSR